MALMELVYAVQQKVSLRSKPNITGYKRQSSYLATI